MNVIRDASIPMTPLRDARIGVVGYGNQGRAQALNLRDSGLDVEIGLRDGSASRSTVEADGLTAASIRDVAARADVLFLLAPDETLPGLFAGDVGELRAGGTVGVAHGSVLAFTDVPLRSDVNVVLVAPTGPGVELRDRYVAGDGIPAFAAVHQDATGNAKAIALAYAKAIGCARVGIVMTSVREEAIVDLFGEQAVLCGGLAELVSAGFDTLVEAGFTPEVAYLECVHQIQLTASLVTRFGVDGMWDAISRTARYGSLLRGREVVGTEARAAMRAAVADIENGAFFTRFLQDWEAGGPELKRLRAGARREKRDAAAATVLEWLEKRAEADEK